MSDRKRLDWASVLERLEQIQRDLERAGTPSAERVREILEQRAGRLAKAEGTGESPLADMLVVFTLSGERYAFPVSEVTGILDEVQLTPVPDAALGVAGVAQVRGEILPVYRLHERLGLAGTDASRARQVLLMEVGGRRFAVQADGVDEVRTVNPADRRPARDSADIAWMTEDLVRVLNSASLWTKES
jgi:purine-binding chemotaxis protein CheW